MTQIFKLTSDWRKLARKFIDEMPMGIQRILLKIIREIKYYIFIVKWRHRSNKNIPNPEKIFWISPDRIIYHTNYVKNDDKNIIFSDRVFPSNKMRGKVIDGDWDITDYKFTDLPIYQAFKQRINEGLAWQDTDFYKINMSYIESGQMRWSCSTKDDFDKRCSTFDALIESIKTNGYQLNRTRTHSDLYFNVDFDEIDVNIGRNGEFLFQNGRHRLSIAKILGIKKIPVMVFVRHKEWQRYREFLISYAQEQRGKVYQPLVHPDLADIPFHHNCSDRFEAIVPHLGNKRGIMMDIGANTGFFCHKFEDLGYECYAIEYSPEIAQIAEKIKIAENKTFKIINKSVFELELNKNMKFDVVLALNVFHHFIKRKKTFFQFKDFLNNLETDEMYFEPHLYEEEQMKDAYVNYTETEFVNFILQNTSLNASELIYTARDGRHVYKLFLK